jgi:hypothetical protein
MSDVLELYVPNQGALCGAYDPALLLKNTSVSHLPHGDPSENRRRYEEQSGETGDGIMEGSLEVIVEMQRNIVEEAQ